MKGQTLSVLSLITLLLMVSGNMFGGLIAQREIKESVSYSANDVNQLLEAEIKADIYQKNIRKELNYTQNNVAYRLTPKWNKLDWKDNIPSRDKIWRRFSRKMAESEYGIKTQNRVWGDCSEPKLGEIEIPSINKTILNLEEPSISCSGKMAKAIIPIKQQYTVKNPNNNYLHLADYAITLAEEVKSLSPDKIEGTGSSSTSSCSNPDQSRAKNSAKSEAKNDALQGNKNIASDAYSNTENSRESFISGSTDTSYQGEYEKTDYDKSSCTYECDCSPHPEEPCDTCTGTKYSYKYRYTADTLKTSFNLKDSENKVLTYDGDKRLKFNFVFSHNLE